MEAFFIYPNPIPVSAWLVGVAERITI
ncbi:Protein of unknown function [Bacillus mycoides]|uniref:Uncharacterized protein n=1 Tax=Bacillus mycoides TaxID=1405 RepID=A0A1G4ESN3_BACMY|nr:Protein of unknown function [Bacillus mycoides]